jgi:YbbR domain-containing protein
MSSSVISYQSIEAWQVTIFGKSDDLEDIMDIDLEE